MVDDLSIIRRSQEVPMKQGEKSEFYNLGFQVKASPSLADFMRQLMVLKLMVTRRASWQ